MNITSWKTSRISNYFDVQYFLRFILLLLALYYFNICYIAISDPRGRVYSPFLDHHLNYINWLRNSILYTSNFFTHLFGTNSFVQLPYRLKIPNGPSVETVYACLGLGLMSFWIAFVVSYGAILIKKITWCLVGVFCIWLINCLRVALLLIALQHSEKVNHYLDHHTIFNLIAYSLIILLINFYMKSFKNESKTNVLQPSSP